MARLLWQIGYVWRAYRSPYEMTLIEAWGEASASWEMNDAERFGEPMPKPAEALYHDQMEWKDFR